MHFWSEGLGDRELVMGLGRAKIERKAEMISLTGIVDSPAPWEYEVKIQLADWVTILKTATSRDACNFIAAHVRIPMLARMAWSIVRFVVLLMVYRAARLTGLSRTAPAALSEAGAKKI
jgi:hypothetical protein